MIPITDDKFITTDSMVRLFSLVSVRLVSAQSNGNWVLSTVQLVPTSTKCLPPTVTSHLLQTLQFPTCHPIIASMAYLPKNSYLLHYANPSLKTMQLVPVMPNCQHPIVTSHMLQTLCLLPAEPRCKFLGGIFTARDLPGHYARRGR